jgi:glutamyl-tRNA synthetase
MASDPVPTSRTPVVGRLAPSPTGGLHVGHARTFVLAWLAARREGGRIILRIEDIDASRVRPEAIRGAIEDLRWLGLDWDEGPYLQSRRLPFYEEALERLKRRELVYPCTCTRADIARAASAPHADEEGPSYPGTCAGRSVADASRLGGRAFAWRFRVDAGPVAWNDLVQGAVGADPSRQGGDFVVARPGVGPSYQLAVVVDDAIMGVNQVVRGDDLVPSTPRQLLLYDALGWDPPRFGHVSLVYGPDGRRLAKRDQSIRLAELRARGVDPGRLVAWVARTCGLKTIDDCLSPSEWLARGAPSRLPTEPGVFDPDDFNPERTGPP